VNPQPISFPYEHRASTLLGAIRRPVARVELYSAVFQRWLAYTMVVDTGADHCVLPASVALDLGMPLRQCEPQLASGIGGQQRIFVSRQIRLRVGPWMLLVPVGFVTREDVPPLLGRHQCLDRFDLRLNRFVTTFALARSTKGSGAFRPNSA